MIVAKMVERFGSKAQNRELVGGVAAGVVASIVMSEPAPGRMSGRRAVARSGPTRVCD